MLLHNIFYSYIILLLQCDIAKSYVREGNRLMLKDKQDFYTINKIHHVKERDVSTIAISQKPGKVQSKDQTIIILPNEGNKYPYNSNPYSRYNPYDVNNQSGGTMIVLKNPDTSYKTGYSG
ncbi:unnamed protein product, partial [Brenthis ino]